MRMNQKNKPLYQSDMSRSQSIFAEPRTKYSFGKIESTSDKIKRVLEKLKTSN